MEHDSERDRDEEFDDFESMLERQTETGEREWRKTESETPSPAETSNADDAGESSDIKSDETAEQAKRIVSSNAFAAGETLAEFSDEEQEWLKGSEEPLAESNPEQLKALLDAKLADSYIDKHTYVAIPIVSPDGQNPGWVVEHYKTTQKSAAELVKEDKWQEAYQRKYYDSLQLTHDQRCETLDLIELKMLELQRDKSAVLKSGHDKIKADKLSKAQAKRVSDDMSTPPGTYAEAAVKKARREAKLATPKISAADIKKIEQMVTAGIDYEEIGRKWAKKGILTSEIAEYLKSQINKNGDGKK